jgi:BirA family transcriptional regulator, biotin operon repressor / biotin---[acetyl-CoA-carboxylase] ligase
MMNRIGSAVLRYDRLPSTNDVARELALAHAPEGVAVVARGQSAGRGRQGRAWASPPGQGLYCSVILRPRIPPADATMITLAAAIAVVEMLADDYQIVADIKWPNDVHVRGRKLCGILVESAIESGVLQFAIMGIGVNIAQREFPADLKDIATSLLIESGKEITPDEFLGPLLARLDVWYRKALAQPAEIIAQWEARSSYARDCAVRVESSDGVIEGTTRGLAPSGALTLELTTGEQREIVSGDVTLRKG